MVKRVNNRPDQSRQHNLPDLDAPTLPDRVEPVSSSGFLVREQLSTMISVHRKPPPLRLETARDNTKAQNLSADLSPEALKMLADMTGDALALQLAELSLRLSKIDDSDFSRAQKRGAVAVNQLMRMCEHLHIMKTSQPVQ